MTDLITARAVDFIEQHAAEPFFLEVAYNAAHWPFQPPDRYSRSANNGAFQGPASDPPATRADYAAMLERADEGVGDILQSLERLGLTANTLVIFTNDNGGEWLSRNTPLFNHKMSVWEGGIRVPAIIRWPGRIPAGTVTSQVGITMDLTASILAASGVVLPANMRLDGMNLFPILEGRAPQVDRTLFWRVHPVPPRNQRAVRSGNWKLVMEPRPMLFNLANDVGERENLIGRHPEVARRLRDLLLAWERDVGAEAGAR